MSTIRFDDKDFALVAVGLLRGDTLDKGSLACAFRYPDGWQDFDTMAGVVHGWCEDLKRANVAAWNARYDEHETFAPINFQCVQTFEMKGGCALYKKLQAIAYNLDECDCNKAGVQLARVIAFVAAEVISKLPEYEKAEWAF
jgi:hypothetical protein